MKASKIKKLKGAAKVKCKVSGLKSKKKYFVRVRSFRKVNGKTMYGSWSAAKKVKTR